MPTSRPGGVRIAVSACGVCRTDLHIIDGELTILKSSLTPGHEIVGIIESRGKGVMVPTLGKCAGVPWLDWTRGVCPYCLHGRGNLCDHPALTDYTCDGDCVQYVVCDARYYLPIPVWYDDAHAAPLLCAGLIGYHTLHMADDAHRIGIYSFGTTAYLITQITVTKQHEIFAFTRTDDTATQQFVLDTDASQAGASDTSAPEPLDAALIFTSTSVLVPQALQAVVKGGSMVRGGIHMSDIPAFPYRLLWEERKLVSVANLTRADGFTFMRIATEIPLRVHVTPYPLQDVNTALEDPHAGRVAGVAVLRMPSRDL